MEHRPCPDTPLSPNAGQDHPPLLSETSSILFGIHIPSSRLHHPKSGPPCLKARFFVSSITYGRLGKCDLGQACLSPSSPRLALALPPVLPFLPPGFDGTGTKGEKHDNRSDGFSTRPSKSLYREGNCKTEGMGGFSLTKTYRSSKASGSWRFTHCMKKGET